MLWFREASSRPLTAEVWFRFHGNLCETCGGQRGSGRVLPISVFYHQSSTQSSSSSCCYYQKDKGAKPGNLPKSKFISEFCECWIEKNFHLVVKGSSVSCHAVRHGIGLPRARPDMLGMRAAL